MRTMEVGHQSFLGLWKTELASFAKSSIATSSCSYRFLGAEYRQIIYNAIDNYCYKRQHRTLTVTTIVIEPGGLKICEPL